MSRMRRNRTLLFDPVVGQIERHIPPAAKAAIDFAAVTARVKPCPFKDTVPQVRLKDTFPQRLKPRLILLQLRHGGSRAPSKQDQNPSFSASCEAVPFQSKSQLTHY